MNTERPYCYLIDDDEDDRKFFEEAITVLDSLIKFESQADAKAALHHLGSNKSHVPDYIFLDLNMQPVSGKDCLIQLKGIPHLAEVPVIIYSTRLNEQIIYDTLKLGAFDHIEKPCNKEALVTYLRRVLQLAA
jgi:DNA-binding NtrC family response regulator